MAFAISATQQPLTPACERFIVWDDFYGTFLVDGCIGGCTDPLTCDEKNGLTQPGGRTVWFCCCQEVGNVLGCHQTECGLTYVMLDDGTETVECWTLPCVARNGACIVNYEFLGGSSYLVECRCVVPG